MVLRGENFAIASDISLQEERGKRVSVQGSKEGEREREREREILGGRV